MRKHLFRALWITAMASYACQSSAAGAGTDAVRLYAMDCGSIEFKDMGLFSDAGDYDGKPGRLVDPCFLVQHPKGNLLWDTGLGDAYVGKPAVPNSDGITLRVEKRLIDQLAELKVIPANIQYLAFSHFHADHTGNANLFPQATWIFNQADLDWAMQPKTPPVVALNTFSKLKDVKTNPITGDLDVFGDGRVRILKAPGHTPGSQCLMIKLEHAGYIILSGDLYHQRTDRVSTGNVLEFRTMASNSSRADALASFARIENLLKTTKGRLVVQHDAADVQSLPVFPKFLD